jgi:hypothetical protein
MKAIKFITAFIVVNSLFSVAGLSQESAEELAKAAQNPIANMLSFPFCKSSA